MVPFPKRANAGRGRGWDERHEYGLGQARVKVPLRIPVEDSVMYSRDGSMHMGTAVVDPECEANVYS